MATGFGSTAASRSRALGIGLTDEVVALLKNGGVGTLGSLAFITNYQLGQSDEGPLITVLAHTMRRALTNADASRACTSAQRLSPVAILWIQFCNINGAIRVRQALKGGHEFLTLHNYVAATWLSGVLAVLQAAIIQFL